MAAQNSEVDITLADIVEDDIQTSRVSSLANAPIRLLFSIISNVLSNLRPFAPQLIPIVFCLFLIPLSLFLSGAAGFFVWRNVAVGWESPIHLQFGDGMAPYAAAPIQQLVSNQPYDISVHLTLPATESNYALGNFMTQLTLSTPSNKTLVSVRRPAIAFPPKTTFFSRRPNTIDLDVPMLSTHVVGTSNIVAYVEIGRGDGWTSLGSGQGREISVISASIRGVVVRRGIRGFIARFPLTFAFMSAMSFLAVLLCILGACVLPVIIQRSYEDYPNSPANSIKELPSAITSESEEKPFEKPPLRRRRSRQRRSTSRKTRENAAVSSTPMPTAASQQIPLRRRRSRPFDDLEDSDS